MKTRIYDTFNRRTVSNHRSLKAAVVARRKFNRSITKHNGGNSYIPTRIEELADDGEWIGMPIEEVQDMEQYLFNR